MGHYNVFLLRLQLQNFFKHSPKCCSQWPRGLRRRSAAARLLRLWVRIPAGAWMSVCCECCVLSGAGLCDELITRPEESYRLCCVVVCDLETSWVRRSWPTGSCDAEDKQTVPDSKYLLEVIILLIITHTFITPKYFQYYQSTCHNILSLSLFPLPALGTSSLLSRHNKHERCNCKPVPSKLSLFRKSILSPLRSFLQEISSWKLDEQNNSLLLPSRCKWGQGRIKLFGAPRQWKHFRPLFQAVFLSGGGITPQTESNTTPPPSPKTEITNILLYILNFASIIKFKM